MLKLFAESRFAVSLLNATSNRVGTHPRLAGNEYGKIANEFVSLPLCVSTAATVYLSLSLARALSSLALYSQTHKQQKEDELTHHLTDALPGSVSLWTIW